MNRYAFNESTQTKEKPFLHKSYLSVVEQFMNMNDSRTRESVMYMNEADQSKVLLALTNKLYDAIVDKVDEIDYGEIPLTKGDLTRLSKYNDINECLTIIRNILIQYKQPTTSVDTIVTAMSNITSRRDLFMKAFRFNLELPVVLYCNIVMAIIGSLSLLISGCIEFIKTPSQDTFSISLDKAALGKTMENMLFISLIKFNAACAKGDVDKVINNIISNKVKGVKEASGTLLAIGGIVAGLALIAAIPLVILPMLKDLVFFFYYNKMKLSEFFEVQANLLTMNAYNLESNQTMDQDQKEKIVKKQMTIANNFRKISNKFLVNIKESENKANKEIALSSRKMSIGDLDDNINPGLSLF